MRCGSYGLFSTVMGIAASALLASAPTQAGQYKTLNTATLAAGGSIEDSSTPKNPLNSSGVPGGAMEMETYEFQTGPAGGSYYCQIVSNATNKTLNVSLIGVNGTVITSCSAVSGGSCNTLTESLVGTLKFQCVVATQCCSSPSTAGYYIVGVHH